MDSLPEFEAATPEQWRAAAEKLLKGKSFDETLLTETYEGITLQPIYHPTDNIAENEAVFPGAPPYKSGTHAAGSRDWEICQEILATSAEDFNAALRHDLEGGQTAIRLRMENGHAAGGLNLSNLSAWEASFENINLEKWPLFISSDEAAVITGGFVAALVEKKRFRLEKLHGCIAADPLAALALNGNKSMPLEQEYDGISKFTKWAAAAAPKLQTLLVRGDIYHNAGANAVQELSFAIAVGVSQVREMSNRGLIIDDVLPRMRFSFALGSNFFMEIAKLRAARILWRNVANAFGAKEESGRMFIHAVTSAQNKMIFDAHNNLLRATTEALSGTAGGCDSLQIAGFDAGFRQPNAFSRRISRNIAIILKAESLADQVADPAGGSWYVEALTNELAEKAWTLFQKVEAEGGMVTALKTGFPQKEIRAVAEKRLANLIKGKDKLIGVNSYPNPNEEEIENENTPAKFPKNDSAEIDIDLADNSIVEIIKAAKKGATMAEIRAALSKMNGKENDLQVTPLPALFNKHIFAELRAAALAQGGKKA